MLAAVLSYVDELLNSTQVGFGWSVRILGFTALATLILPVWLMEPRVRPGKVRNVIDWSAFTDVPFVRVQSQDLNAVTNK